MNSSPTYEQYHRLYKQLSVMIDQGQGESEDAEHLRSLMDPLWNSLTEEEQEEFRPMFLDQCR